MKPTITMIYVIKINYYISIRRGIFFLIQFSDASSLAHEQHLQEPIHYKRGIKQIKLIDQIS